MKKIFVYIILIITIFSALFEGEVFASQVEDNSIINSQFRVLDTNDLNIYSDCILMIEKNTGDILYEKNANKKMYPASTTKILTAILVLENCNLDELARVSSTALKAVPSNYVKSNIQIGEKMRVEDLLYAMLIPSANDAANVLAEHVSGSMSGFVELMNDKAKDIGCTNSNFTNPSGIHDKNLYTTAHDLALIARYAMNFEVFRKIVSTQNYALPSTESYPRLDRTFTTTNLLLNQNEQNYYYEYATGIKTGHTSAAKECLVASAKKDDVEFIIVILGSGLKEKYLDCKTLFNFAFDNYITHYKELQQKQQKIINLSFLFNNSDTKSEVLNYSFLRNLSKIIAVIAILLAFILLFKKKKVKRKKKSKSRY